jgi:hypothetical protein
MMFGLKSTFWQEIRGIKSEIIKNFIAELLEVSNATEK